MTIIHKITNKAAITGLLALMTVGLLSACGGGDASSNKISYSGLTSQAVLTSKNDDAFGTAMLEGGVTSGEVQNQVPTFAITRNEAVENPKAHIALMELLAAEVQSKIEQQSSQTDPEQMAALGALQAGNCGGSFDVSGSTNGGTITYDNYCVGNNTFSMTLNGVMSFSITGDLGGDNYEIIISYNQLTSTIKYDEETFTYTFSGTITITSVDGVRQVTFTSQFEHGGKVFMVEDLVISNGSISGRLYHPEYGYVDITTDPAFSKIPSGQYCGGTLHITAGDNSSSMTVNENCTEYTIQYNNEVSETIQWP